MYRNGLPQPTKDYETTINANVIQQRVKEFAYSRQRVIACTRKAILHVNIENSRLIAQIQLELKI